MEPRIESFNDTPRKMRFSAAIFVLTVLSLSLFFIGGHPVSGQTQEQTDTSAPVPVSCGEHEAYSQCSANPKCQKTCENYGDWETIPCSRSRECVPGCVCEDGYVRDELNNCVWQNRCPRVRH